MITHSIKIVDELPTEMEHGAVYVLRDGKSYMYTSAWEEIGSQTWSNGNTQKMPPSNCKNCGAALHGNTCEYCGTTYN